MKHHPAQTDQEEYSHPRLNVQNHGKTKKQGQEGAVEQPLPLGVHQLDRGIRPATPTQSETQGESKK